MTIATDVRPAVAHALAGRIPGVTEATVYLTSYPYRDLAAQVLGTVGPITAAEVNAPVFRGLPATAVVGQTGLEYFYDRYLRGHYGLSGDALKTSLDLGLERAGQASLAKSMARNTPGGAGGAFVAMDPQNGQVYAMGSLPSYDPNIFTKPIPRSVYSKLISAKSGDPLNNRATDGQYPTGSPLKVITAIAALESGHWRVGKTYDDTGSFCFSPGGICLHNAGNVAHGVLDLANAIRVSDDNFFYSLGAKLNVDPQSHPLGGRSSSGCAGSGSGRQRGSTCPMSPRGTGPTRAGARRSANWSSSTRGSITPGAARLPIPGRGRWATT